MSSPTMTVMPGTKVGMILGTAAYMSPEQARGGLVDKRADIWAFGVVVFEMLSGRQLFAADTVTDTLVAVLKGDIDYSALPPTTPPALRQLLRRCLERNPKHPVGELSPDDWQAAMTIQGESRDLWITLLERGTQSRLTSGEGTEFDPIWSHDGRELFYVFDRPPFSLFRIGIGAPDTGHPIWNEPGKLDTSGVAVSHDGRMVAFELSAEQTGRDLYYRPLDGSAPARPIRSSRSEERNVSFSPDDSWVVYQSNENGRVEVYAQPFPGPGDRIQLSTDGGSDPLWARNGEVFYLHDNEVRVIAARPKGRTEFDKPETLFSYPIIPGSTRGADLRRDPRRQAHPRGDDPGSQPAAAGGSRHRLDPHARAPGPAKPVKDVLRAACYVLGPRAAARLSAHHVARST